MKVDTVCYYDKNKVKSKEGHMINLNADHETLKSFTSLMRPNRIG